MRPSHQRHAISLLVALLLLVLLPGSAVGSSPPKFPTQGTEALARDSWIVTLANGADLGSAGRISKRAGGKLGLVYGHALNGFQFKGSAKAADALRHNPKVASVTPDRALHLTETLPFGIERVHAWSFSGPSDGAYQAGFQGTGARIAILDTGIDLDHPDLVASIDLPSGKNCFSDTVPPNDGHGHGTHVSGTAAAPLNGQGVVGIAPEAQLVPIKMFDDAGNSSEALSLCALNRVVALNTDANPANDIDVVSMSWGDHREWGTCAADALHGAICAAKASGAILVAGAGNDAVDAGDFVPAAFPEVISVSGYTDLDGKPGGLGGCPFISSLFWWECDDTMAFFSDFGPSVDVIAPGVNIYSTWKDGGYNTIDGTSMSTPHVSGIVALMRAANPSLTADDALEVLQTTGECPNGAAADSDFTPGCAGQGNWADDPDGIAEPLPNALRAAQAAATWQPRPDVEITSPANGASVAGSVTVTAAASSPIGIASVEFAVNGVATTTDTDGSDGYSFVWETSLLDDGAYSITATAIDTAGRSSTTTINVYVGVNIKGDWVGEYGADGYALLAWNGSTDLVNLPGATLSLDQGGRATWSTSTADSRALESPAQSERRAMAWWGNPQIQFHLTFDASYTGTLHLYALDWDTVLRRENVTVDDGTGPQQVTLSTPFNDGAWLHFPISAPAGGQVTVTVDRIAGSNAVLSGLFLGGGGPLPPPPPALGDWVGEYGADGYALLAWNGSTDLVNLPGATLSLDQGGRATWSTSTADSRALESPAQSERRAMAWWGNPQIQFHLTFDASYTGTLHLYALDWDTVLRRENVTVDDGTGPQQVTLSTPFNDGAWLHFPISAPAGGQVTVTVDRIAGSNAVLSGLFLGGGQVQPPPSPPGAPTLDTVAPGNAQVTLAWSAPASDGGSAITGYTATASPGGATCSTAGATTCTVTGLTNGTSYSFSVTATNAVGTGPASNALSATPRTVPGAPTLNTATPGNSQVTLAWSAPASNGGSAITGYTATASPGGATCSTAGTTCTVTGLTNGTSYSFSVTAANAAGQGAASNTLSATPRTVPGAPTLNSATAGDTVATLGWSAPASNGGSAITGYTATASPGGATCTTAGTTSCTVSGLTNGVSYSFSVTATNAAGTGPASNVLSATPTAAATPPGAPTLNTATPGNGQVALAWSAPASNGGSAITGYTATASPGGATCSTAGATTCTVTGLTNGTSYSFSVTATNTAGTGPASNALSATPRTVPGAPTLTVATPGNAQVTLAWSAPASNGGSAITGYTATASPGGATCSTAGTTCTVTGLTNGTSYSFTVRATNAAGQGAASNALNATPRTVPGAPRNLTASPHKSRGVNLAWQAPLTNGGAAITNYLIYRRTSSGTLAQIATVSGTTLSYRDTGTSKGVLYFYVVRAVNVAGESTSSNEASAVAK